jgi:membrane associated rhomboid family serine protease
MTYALIATNVMIFLYQLTLSAQQGQELMYLFGIVPARYTDPQWAAAVGLTASPLPFFTMQFLHGGLLHLLGNMWMLWVFGDNVEDRMGRFGFLCFYVSTGLLAGATHFVTNFGSRIPAIGASGAIAGVLAAYVVLFPKARVLTLIPIFFYPLFVEIPALFFIGVWFLGQLFSGTLALFDSAAAGIAWWAHIGGFVAGIALYRVFARRPSPRRPVGRVLYPWGPDGPAVIEPRQDDEENGRRYL